MHEFILDSIQKSKNGRFEQQFSIINFKMKSSTFSFA